MMCLFGCRFCCKPTPHCVREKLETLRQQFIRAESELRTYSCNIGYWDSSLDTTPEQSKEYTRLYNILRDKKSAYEDYKRYAETVYRQTA